MDSDKRSIQEQGGGAPKPYSPKESGEEQNSPFTPNQEAPKPPQNTFPQGGEGGIPQNTESAQFPPSAKVPEGRGEAEKTSFPPTPSPVPGGGNEPPKGGEVKPLGPEKPAGKKKKSGKNLFVPLLVIIIIIGVLAAGYFFVYPTLKGGENRTSEKLTTTTTEGAGAAEEEITTEKTTTTEEGFGVPTIPVGGEEEATTTKEEEASTTEEEGVDSSTGGIPADAHVSLFSSPADSTVEKELGTIEIGSVRSALEISPTDVPLFREVVLTDKEGNIIRSEELLKVIAPNTFPEAIRQSFNADPTLFTYTDNSGTWFGLALQAKSTANLEELKASVSEIENNIPEVKNFFLTDPGNETSWKDGGVGDVTSRYLSFSKEGASFNYGWADDILIISGSYSAFGKAINNL